MKSAQDIPTNEDAVLRDQILQQEVMENADYEEDRDDDDMDEDEGAGSPNMPPRSKVQPGKRDSDPQEPAAAPQESKVRNS